MRCNFRCIFWFAFIFMFAAHSASAATVPTHFLVGRTDWTFQTFGEACFSMQSKASSIPCNPALLSLDQNRLGGYVFFGQNIESISDLSKVIGGQADLDTARSLMQRKRFEEVNAEVEINWVRESWSFSLVPYRLNYRSEIKDRALTYVSLYGNLESSVRAQKSFLVTNTLRLGVQLQASYRRFVASDFFATDILVEGGVERYLPSRHQGALGLTPGLSWSLENYFSYHPQLSLTVNNLEVVDHKFDEFPGQAEFQLGASFQPPVFNDNLEIGAHFQLPSLNKDSRHLFRLAAAYTQEKNTWGASLNLHQFDFGYHHDFKIIKAGAVLDYQKIEDNLGAEESLTTFYFQLGTEI